MNDWDDLTHEERDDFREDMHRRAIYLPQPEHYHRYEPIDSVPNTECRFRCVTRSLPRCKREVLTYAEMRARGEERARGLERWTW